MKTNVFEKLELEFGFGLQVYIYASTHWGKPHDYAVSGKASLQGARLAMFGALLRDDYALIGLSTGPP